MVGDGHLCGNAAQWRTRQTSACRSSSATRSSGRCLPTPGPSAGLSSISHCGSCTVFVDYSAFARGADQLGGSYTFLDLTALGRQEWEEPKGRVESANRNIPDFS